MLYCVGCFVFKQLDFYTWRFIKNLQNLIKRNTYTCGKKTSGMRNKIAFTFTLFIIGLFAIIFLNSCNIGKRKTSKDALAFENVYPAIVDIKQKKMPDPIYQASRTHLMDLQHTWLDVKFDYSKQHLLGKACLSFKPWFYANNKLVLDAKGMDLHRVALLKNNDTLDLNYSYDTLQINIALDKTYKRNESFKIFIDYTAKPNDLKTKGSAAITDAKGLYFINPLRETADKPRQIWTQGETESNSCWFPTIDAPNEKHTQEIYITADKNDVTLCNGDLIYSKINADGTHTDYWKQMLPHAPYLTMMAVGEFVVTKDKWRDTVEVNYYLEPAYAPFAKLIFGTTSEMIECFSQRLGVDYPWDKFSQVVVRDFVSGAMENTSAVVHYELVQHDAREHLDNTHEDIISHELFHQWFGDLVTCESWSNIPLNESFATYGEYLWNEWKHGRMEADYTFDENLAGYLNSKNAENKIPIRYKYHDKEDMFDAVSYSKGGRILHMLRYAVGDDAFFKSLQLYLTKNKFKTVEIHELRLAFEEITGMDLNWFFNQWFLQAGHPELELKYEFNTDKTEAKLIVKQVQDSTRGVYQLPLDVDVYSNNKRYRERIFIDKKVQEFVFKSDEKIELINFDAENILLGTIKEELSIEENLFKLTHANLYIDKRDATNEISKHFSKTKNFNNDYKLSIRYCLTNSFWGVKELALNLINKLPDSLHTEFEPALIELANYKSKSDIRYSAIETLAKWNAKKHKSVFENALNDSSYQVLAKAILALNDADSTHYLSTVESFKSLKNGRVQNSIAKILSSNSVENENSYFKSILGKFGYQGMGIMASYGNYLLKQNDEITDEGITILTAFVSTKKLGYAKYYLPNVINQLIAKYNQRVTELDKKIASAQNANEKTDFQKQKEIAKQFVNRLELILPEEK